MRKRKVLLVAHNLDDFVGADLKILKKKYNVNVITMGSFFEIIGNFFKLFSSVRETDLCFIWFGASYAMLTTIFCKIFGKKSVIIAGGHDVVKMKEVDYGLLLHPVKQYFPKISFWLTDKILTFSNASKRDLLKNFGPMKKAETVYLGFEPKMYKPISGLKKEKSVVTICEVKGANLRRKGLITLAKAAEKMPNVEFVIIGRIFDLSIGDLKKISGKNIKFPNFLPLNKLISKLQKAKVYAQLSAHEGFGYALAESMLLECVPVVTNRGSLPEVVGNAGFYTGYRDVNKTIRAIKKALKSNKGKEARKRIIKKFPLKAREKRLLKVINELI